MDLKHREFYCRVTASGVGEQFTVSGSYIACMTQVNQWLLASKVQKDRSGASRITIEFSDSQFTDNKNQPDWMGLIDPNDVEQISDEDLAAMYKPIARDSQWERFQFLGATQSNFERAPDEYDRLWDHFESTYPDDMRDRKRRSIA